MFPLFLQPNTLEEQIIPRPHLSHSGTTPNPRSPLPGGDLADNTLVPPIPATWLSLLPHNLATLCPLHPLAQSPPQSFRPDMCVQLSSRTPSPTPPQTHLPQNKPSLSAPEPILAMPQYPPRPQADPLEESVPSFPFPDVHSPAYPLHFPRVSGITLLLHPPICQATSCLLPSVLWPLCCPFTLRSLLSGKDAALDSQRAAQCLQTRGSRLLFGWVCSFCHRSSPSISLEGALTVLGMMAWKNVPHAHAQPWRSLGRQV